MSLQVKILTPTGERLNTQAKTMTATGLLGEFGILPDHLPYVTALKIGMATIEENELTRYFALGDGFAEVQNDTVTIFVDTVEEATEIDKEQADIDFKEADAKMSKLDDAVDSPEFNQAQRAYQRALTRVETAKFAVEYHQPGK